MDELRIEKAGSPIWAMEHKENGETFIGLRFDCGDSGFVKLTRDQVQEVIDSLKPWDDRQKRRGVMADTKQATAETVCAHCGDPIIEGPSRFWSHKAGHTCCGPNKFATPHTQPSQTELRISDDLKCRYKLAKAQLAILPPAKAAREDQWTGLRFQCEEVMQLIERIARLESAIRWATGESDEFPERKPGEGAYWWRTELMRRARLEGGR